MTLHEFQNTARILHSIDGWELPWLGPADWCAFRDAPVHFLLRCDDRTADRIWRVVEARQRRDEELEGAEMKRELPPLPDIRLLASARTLPEPRWSRNNNVRLRAFLWARDGNLCNICGCIMTWWEPWGIATAGANAMTVDHIRPRSQRGSDRPFNLRLAHKSCNSERWH